jgi:ATP-grasp domain
VPFEHPLRVKAFDAAKRLVESFEGLRGYIGVDLVFSEDTAHVLEVNPRLTTSYVGLRKVANFNVAQAIINSVLKGELPKYAGTKGYACFSKVTTAPCSGSAWQRACRMGSVVSPPFPLSEKEPCALVESLGSTAEIAKKRLDEAKKKLRGICLGGRQAR